MEPIVRTRLRSDGLDPGPGADTHPGHGGRPGARARLHLLELGRALEDLDREPPAHRHQHQRGVLATELAEGHGGDGVAGAAKEGKKKKKKGY